jgi:pSer/pThr/pTyr-binding forkhead associated (FHA) protein/ribosomal protein L40E
LIKYYLIYEVALKQLMGNGKTIGLVCSVCDAFNDFSSGTCSQCGGSLTPGPEIRSFLDKINVSVYKGELIQEDLKKEPPMEQARHYICPSCYSQVPLGHKFCGKCGAATPFAEGGAQVKYFGAMQVPGRARLIIIRGEEMEGLSFHLNAEQHPVGKTEGVILFNSDPWVSPKHANFYYREGRLFVRDENSVNGVYIRIREPIVLNPGDHFTAGEQLFRFELAEDIEDIPDGEDTYFFHSPWEKRTFKVVQALEGGIDGMQVHDKGGELTIGRDDCDMNFYDDEFMSLRQVKIKTVGQKFELEDLGSKNGTFIRIRGEQAIIHGDYVLIGKEVLRVEIV